MLKCVIFYFMVDIFMIKGFINPFVKQRLIRKGFKRTDNDPQNDPQNLDLDPTFNASFFPSLQIDMSYKDMPKLFSEKYEAYSKKYPWLARVVTTETEKETTICPAACIRPLVFLAAARCIVGLTIGVFGIMFENIYYETKAVVIPDEKHHSKQYFDDFAFVVVVKSSVRTSTWTPVPLFDDTNRTDDTFQWFDKLGYEDKEIQHKLLAFNFDMTVDYAENVDGDILPSKLYEQDVVVGIRFCQRIFTRNHTIKGYFVPCAFVCTEAEFNENNQNNVKCSVQIRETGAMIINTKTNKLLGVTTWGALDQNQDHNQLNGFKLPVGFAVPNSENFFNDLECAQKVAKAENDKHVRGYYQEVCSPSKETLRKPKHEHKGGRHHYFYNNYKYSYSDSLDLSEFY